MTMKRFFIVVAALQLQIAIAVKPPNYIEKPKVPDKYPPKYEYNYFVANRHNQAAQGHKEIRNGDNTAGNYFVNLPKGESKTIIDYIADEWGFWPITRYLTNGPHHRTSGHFALGQHAVERLNQTQPHFITQNSIQQADASISAPQIALNSPPQHTKLFPINSHTFNHHRSPPPQPFKELPKQQFQYIYNNQPPKHQQQPLIYHQHPPQIPLIYEYHQHQQSAPQVNYFQQQAPHEVIYHQQPIVSMAELQQGNPAFLPTAIPLVEVLPTAGDENNGNINVEAQISQQLLEPQQEPSNADITVVKSIISDQQPQQLDLNGNLLVHANPQDSVATSNQENAKIEDDAKQQQGEQFSSPIVVNEESSSNGNDETIIVQQKNRQQKVLENYHQQQPQINVKILTDAKQQQIDAQPLVNGHTNNNNYQYLVDDDQDSFDSTLASQKEAPSRQFLRNFKKFNSGEQVTTTVRTIETSTASGCCKDSNGKCCGDEDKVKVISSSNLLAPVHVGLRLSNEKLEDCIDGHQAFDKIVEVRKNVNVKQSFVTTTTKKTPTFGDRIILSSSTTPIVTEQPVVIISNTPKFISSTSAPPPPSRLPPTAAVTVQEFKRPVYISSTPPPSPSVVTKFVDRPVYIKSEPEIIEKVVHHPLIKEQPIFIEKIIKQNVEVDRPVYIKSPPETKIIKEPVFIEKQVLKEVKVPVEKTKIVHQPILQTVEKPIFYEKIVKQPITVEKIVEKPVIQTVEKYIDRPIVQTVEKIVEKPVFVEKYIDRPVEKIVEKPVLQTVEKLVDRPVLQTVEKIVEKPIYIEKIVEKPVIQTVEKPVIQTVEKPIYIEKEKFVERPVHVPYPVPIEKHVYHKPDFHVIAKATPHKHKLFDFDALLGFLTKKQEVKHIYVPASPQYQLNQLGKHQLLAATYTTIDPVREAPVFDYSRYATSHLNPIKPVYGVPSTVLQPIANSGYSAPDPYAGTYTAQSHSAWAYDSVPAQSQISQVHKDNYVGPTPQSDDYWAINGVSTKDGIKFRRNVENGRSLRIEYGGFYPKINPSVEIDGNGTPIKKNSET